MGSVNSFSERVPKPETKNSDSMLLTGASYMRKCLMVCPWRRCPCIGTQVPAPCYGRAPSRCCCNTYIRFQDAIHRFWPTAPARTHCRSPCYCLRPALSATDLQTRSLRPRGSACNERRVTCLQLLWSSDGCCAAKQGVCCPHKEK